jgi:galactokinase
MNEYYFIDSRWEPVSGNSLSHVEELYRLVYGGSPQAVVSAPGRVDFLNTHQDYKRLPVVGIAISLRTFVAASKSKICRVYSRTLDARDEFTLEQLGLRGGRWFGDYLRASLMALRELGYDVGCVNAIITSSVPVGAGLASSAALLVAFISALSELYGLGLGPREVAETAFKAENEVMGIPCGRLDQYTSAYGGVVLIETRPPYRVELLELGDALFVVADSGVRHSTAEIHPKRQGELNEALRRLLKMNLPEELKSKLSMSFAETKWDEISEEEISKYLRKLPKKLANRILYTLKAHSSTMIAVRVLKGYKPKPEEVKPILERVGLDESVLGEKNWDLRIIGAIMTYQHMLLSQLYEVSIPLLDKLVEAALKAGALGAKLSGAGMGGAVIALVRDSEEAEKVLDAVMRAGAARAWIVEVDRGVYRHK